jgi:flagellar protein FliO/FliZ
MNKIVRTFSVVFALGLITAVASAAPSDQNEIIVPNTTLAKTAAPASGSAAGSFTAVAVILLAGVGGWLVWRNRSGGITALTRTPRQLVIEETRSLGNRQFVVVAAYQDKKFLLGVCPGRIDFLAPLSDSTPMPAVEKVRS